MRKCISIAFLAGAAGCVHAQSSVTLYGIVGAGFAYNSNLNGSRQYSMVSGGYHSDRWGLIGTEDLGGGTKAIFNLTAGFSAATGQSQQGGTFFGQQAYVGLSGRAGTVTLGRQYGLLNVYPGLLSSGADWAAPGISYGGTPGEAANLISTNRVNNMVQYSTPAYRGLTISGQYSFGGQPGSITKNQIWSLGAIYTSGPVILAAAYQHTDTPNFSLFGNQANSSPVNNNIANVIIAGYATAGSQQIFAFAGSYALGSVTTALIFSSSQFRRLGSVAVANMSTTEAAYRGNATVSSAEINVKYQFKPDLLLAIAYIYARDTGVSDSPGAKYSQVNAGVIYSLSKRTDLTGLLVHQVASGVNSLGNRAVASIGPNASNTNTQTACVLSIEHRF